MSVTTYMRTIFAGPPDAAPASVSQGTYQPGWGALPSPSTDPAPPWASQPARHFSVGPDGVPMLARPMTGPVMPAWQPPYYTAGPGWEQVGPVPGPWVQPGVFDPRVNGWHGAPWQQQQQQPGYGALPWLQQGWGGAAGHAGMPPPSAYPGM